MLTHKKVIVVLMLLGFVIFMFGCGAAKKNAQLATQYKASEWKPKVQEMANNMDDYNIYAAGISRARPWAIGFLPKNNTKRLTGTPEQWHKIEDKKTLDDLIGWMEAKPNALPRLLSVLGPEPDRAFFGYIYTPMGQINTRIVDENTIFVFVPDPTR